MERKPMHLDIKKGGLHEALGMKPDTPIKTSKLESLKNSEDPHMRKMANFALNARGWNHGGSK